MLLRVRNGNPRRTRRTASLPDQLYPANRIFSLPVFPERSTWRGAAGEGKVITAESRVSTHRSSRDCRTLPTDAGCLLESMRDLQNAEIIPVTSYDLDADRQFIRCKAGRN